VIENKS